MAFIAPVPLLNRAPGARPSALPRRAPARPAASPRPASLCMSAAVPQPLHDRVLVRLDEVSAPAGGSVLLSASAKKGNKQQVGTVVAVGGGRYSTEGAHEPIPVAVGDRVVWKNDYGSEPIDIGTEDEPILALRAYSIIGKL